MMYSSTIILTIITSKVAAYVPTAQQNYRLEAAKIRHKKNSGRIFVASNGIAPISIVSNPSSAVNQDVDIGDTTEKSNIRNSAALSSQRTENSEVEKVPSAMPEAIYRFFFGPDHGPVIIIASIAFLLGYRSMASIGIADLFVGISAIVFWWFQEHFIHRHLLHSSWNWVGKTIHKSHHEKDYFHISIDPAPLLLGWLGTAHLLLRQILPLDLALSATICYAIAGMWYEWTHYIVHTKVRPKTKFMKNVKSHHIKHHIVDDANWLGFSLPLVDEVFGTNPDVKALKQKM